MVCPKCEKKLAKQGLATTDVWKPADGNRNERKVGENKLIGAKKRYAPYTPPSAGGSSKGKGAGSVTFDKCQICSVTVSRAGAKLCQADAYKRGVCAMCTKPIMDTSMHKMSAK